MSARIRQLEDALKVEHAANVALGGFGAGRHPLLVGEGMEVKMGIEVLLNGGLDEGSLHIGMGQKEAPKKQEDEEVDEEALEQSFGLMSVGESGEMRFLGRAANEAMLMVSWVLFSVRGI